ALPPRVKLFPEKSRTQFSPFVVTKSGAAAGPFLNRGSDNTKPIDGSVALVGGGIANLIAAYELSRCGVKVTLFEQQGVDPTKGQKPLGGRLSTDVKDGYV